jgi:enamine deaminase RidA (YjgF/YER057c/UK114 family)
MSVERLDTNPRMSQIVIHRDTIYLSGQVADDTAVDFQGQMLRILAKIDALLARAGSHKGQLIAATIWLSTMADFSDMNKAWEAWIPNGAAPARATVEARLVTPAHRIEISVVAAKPSS